MNILYFSAMFEAERCKKVFTKEKKPMAAASKYHRLMCEGLERNEVSINSYSSLPVNKQNCNRMFVKVPSIKTGNWVKEYISVVNIPFIRHLQIFIKSFLKSLIAANGTVILFDPLVVASAYGAVLGAKCSRKKIVAIVTDLPMFMPIAKNKRLLGINEKLYSFADGFVFLTEQMNESINHKKKPFIVLEGHADESMIHYSHSSFDISKKIIVYAGSLRKIYGISLLCEAFLKINIQNSELHIFGDGDYADELRELTNKNANIIFHGNCPNKEVVLMELKATLLVNPRPTEGEYTKYSFPSKTIEYMASGTPVLCSRLQGIPKEYDEYLYYFDDKAPDGLEKALKYVLEKDSSELEEKGRRAKMFVLENKNNVAQAKKVAIFIKNSICQN